MKIAIVHDWLTGVRGGERCLEVFLALYPDADLFTLIHVPGATTPQIESRVRGTSYLQRFPHVSRYYRALLPLYPSAARRLPLTDYDLVISLSHAAAKNVIPGPNAVHISYCFTPMRYIWDQAPLYFGSATPLLLPIIRNLRSWDVRGSTTVTRFVAISRFIAARIRCFYHRSSDVIPPPVDVSWIQPISHHTQGEAFLYAGALVPYKRPDLVVEAFNRIGEKLWVVGSGPEERRLREIARPNITFTGYVSDAELASYYARCRALVFPGKEDFGMIPVECMAAGRPVIALDRGGAAETVRGVRHWIGESPHDATGVFVHSRKGSSASQDLDALLESLRYFLDHEHEFLPSRCIERARSFSPHHFARAWERTLVSVLGGSAPSRSVPPEAALG
jgi:glycosyltransferase involved in cell wall biosynthesis